MEEWRSGGVEEWRSGGVGRGGGGRAVLVWLDDGIRTWASTYQFPQYCKTQISVSPCLRVSVSPCLRVSVSPCLPTSNFQLPTSNSQLPTPNSQLPTPNFQLPTPNSQLPTPNSQLPTPNSQLPTPNSQLPTPNSQLPTRWQNLPVAPTPRGLLAQFHPFPDSRGCWSQSPAAAYRSLSSNAAIIGLPTYGRLDFKEGLAGVYVLADARVVSRRPAFRG
ncbi:hypothetical protein FF011L_03670 [Roseimaritima multifibrata]|uniref:Uncharacterized protein n=1 Tax=Roseimaritima multifibrata TaxID=1930274 RepID=A0A517M9R9_9BACT|nr:hypothetical protein FF011L_03670 [Roseimaritima multifibrata]